MIFAETERLRLRSFDEQDIQEVVKSLSNWNVIKWIGLFPMPYTPLHAREWMEKMAALEAAGTPEFCLVTDKKSDQLYGGIGIHPVHSLARHEGDYEIGFWTGQPFWRQGYATEALTAALGWACTRPWIKRLCGTTDFENIPAQRVFEKLGFLNQGLRPRTEGRGNPEITLWFYPKEKNL